MNYVQTERFSPNEQVSADVMSVNNLAFVITYGQEICLITAEFTPDQKASQLASNL